MSSKIDKLREQIADARRRRAGEICALQAQLSAEVAKANKKKGKDSAKADDPANDS
tara:strand:+ start:247 stop:414 length:168 start_codon:yes stop_codon:yes gene_type:complete